MNALLEWLLDLIYPPKCMYCGGILPGEVELVCEKCRNGPMPWIKGQMPKLSGFKGCAVPFFYEAPVRDAILRFKFYGLTKYAAEFARQMAKTVRQELEYCDLVTWVPCSKRRKWTRGYDQAELLARALAKELRLEAVCTLEKKKHNRVQSRIKSTAERRANVAGVYRPHAPTRYFRKRILVVDDVITTGATMSQCGQVLLLAGAGRLSCTAIASAKHENKKEQQVC